MLAWLAVAVTAFIGIELIINGYTVVGVPLAMAAAAGGIMLRSHGLSRLLRSSSSSRGGNPDLEDDLS